MIIKSTSKRARWGLRRVNATHPYFCRFSFAVALPSSLSPAWWGWLRTLVNASGSWTNVSPHDVVALDVDLGFLCLLLMTGGNSGGCSLSWWIPLFWKKKKNAKTSINLRKNKQSNRKFCLWYLYIVFSCTFVSGGSFLHTSQMFGFLYIYGIHVLVSYEFLISTKKPDGNFETIFWWFDSQ